MIAIVQGGQTGVDRGAYEAALELGWRVIGFAPQDGKDEAGPIPPAVAKHLQRCERPGFGARTEANVKLASALLVVVADADDPKATPGTKRTIELAGKHRVRREIADPGTDAAKLAAWIRRMVTYDMEALGGVSSFRLMVAGPRASKWPSGRTETAGLLRRIALELGKPEPQPRLPGVTP